MLSERLVRQYVRELLREDDTGSVYSDLATANAMQSPYGVSFFSSNDLYRIFIKPFVNVVDTAMGKAKEISRRTQTLVAVAFETIATTLIPIFRDDYVDIFNNEKKQIEKIRKEYSDVYKANIDAFRNQDLVWTAFCYDPVAMITSRLVKDSPKAAAKLISVLSGGTMDNYLHKVFAKFSRKVRQSNGGKKSKGRHGDGNIGIWGYYDGSATTGGHYGDGVSDSYNEGVIREKGGEKPQQKTLEDYLTNPKLLQKLEQSDIVQNLRKETMTIVRGTLERIFKQAQAIASAKSIQDLQHKTGKQIKGIEKLAQVPSNERRKAEQAILSNLKKSMKSFYVKNLEDQVQQVIKAGISDSSTFVQDYYKVISKIKAL